MNGQYPTRAPADRKIRLLIVSDSSDRLARLRAFLAASGTEITSAVSPEEFGRACRREHDVAVVDVSPRYLPGVLKELRLSEGHAQASVLVAASQLTAGPELAGVLPKYRAMPCSPADLLTLVRRRTSSPVRHANPRTLL